MSKDERRKVKLARIIVGYPFVLICGALIVNAFLFGVSPAAIALPSEPVVVALTISAVLLLANHTWLMTSTELTRLRYNMHATPEEWDASDHHRNDVPDEGLQELERRHNAHGNATENTVHFSLLALLVAVVSPTTTAACVWIIGFAVGRLGHTFSYLAGMDGARGISMSVSLLSLYGLASYLVLSVVI